MLTVERNANSDAGIILYCLMRLVIIIVVRAAVSLSLDDKTATTCWNEALEDGREFLGHLLEGTLDGFIFALIEDADKLFN
jgi:hypothetical protein